MRKAAFQTVIKLLFLTVIAGSIFSSCKSNQESPYPVTKTLKPTESFPPIRYKEIIEIKAELIGDY